MTTEDKIKNAYGYYYDRLYGIIDKYGRIQGSRVISEHDKEVFTDLCYNKSYDLCKFTLNGINYIQPSELQHLNPKQLTEEDKEFLDRTALELMKIYINGQRPKDFGESMTVARLCYRQALSMLDVKNKQLQDIIEETGLKYTL